MLTVIVVFFNFLLALSPSWNDSVWGMLYSECNCFSVYILSQNDNTLAHL